MSRFSLGLTIVMLSNLCLFAARHPEPPRVFLLDAGMLVELKTRAQKATPNDPLFEAVKSEADKQLGAGPFSVMNKGKTPPSGDKHDYMSQGPYWWPNPKTANGLPYVRRDGERNPEINKITDHEQMNKMTSAVRALALGWYLTADDRYAERAAILLRTWFLDPATRMNPNLNFGQGIPGVNDGRKTGIIESHGLTTVIDALGLIAGSKSWTEKDQQGMEKWFSDFVSWLQTSPNGRGEREATNNHGTHYDVQVADFALFVGNRALAKDILSEAERKRIAFQIEPDGRQPLELERTKAFSYSCMNLLGLMQLARLGDEVGIDLWHFQTKDGRSIRGALDFLLPYAVGRKKWDYKQITGFHSEELTSAFLQASAIYHDPSYLEAANKTESSASAQSLLLRLSVHDLQENIPGKN